MVVKGINTKRIFFEMVQVLTDDDKNNRFNKYDDWLIKYGRNVVFSIFKIK